MFFPLLCQTGDGASVFPLLCQTRGRTDGAFSPLLCQTPGRTDGAFSRCNRYNFYIILTINPGLPYPDEVSCATSLSELFQCVCATSHGIFSA